MEFLKRYRQFRGLTRSELAQKVEINPETLARYERGNRTPKATTIEKLAVALQVTPNDLLGINSNNTPPTAGE